MSCEAATKQKQISLAKRFTAAGVSVAAAVEHALDETRLGGVEEVCQLFSRDAPLAHPVAQQVLLEAGDERRLDGRQQRGRDLLLLLLVGGVLLAGGLKAPELGSEGRADGLELLERLSPGRALGLREVVDAHRWAWWQRLCGW